MYSEERGKKGRAAREKGVLAPSPNGGGTMKTFTGTLKRKGRQTRLRPPPSRQAQKTPSAIKKKKKKDRLDKESQAGAHSSNYSRAGIQRDLRACVDKRTNETKEKHTNRMKVAN